MARIDYPDIAKASEPTRALLAKLKSANVFRMVAHAEPALRPLVLLGNALLFESQLDPQLRELAILRVGHLSGSAYEVFQHSHVARAVGLAEAKIAAVQAGPSHSVFSEDERLVLRFTDEAVEGVSPADATFEAARERLGSQRTVELTITIGYYMMMARILESLRVDMDAEAKLSVGPRGDKR